MVAVPVVFTSTVEFFISAVYMGGYPLAEHDNWKPGNARTIGAGSDNVTLGGTNKSGTLFQQLKIEINYVLQSIRSLEH